MTSSIDVLFAYPKDGLRLFDSMIPIGITQLATYISKNGYKTKVIDFNHYSKDFRRELVKLKPKIVAIGGTTPTRKGSFLTATLAKEILPECITLYGGVHASFSYEDTLKNILK